MASLLVSVRSADEARAALAGGAAVIDVKEPNRGPLGRAEPEVWQAVRQAIPRNIPVSVALGELLEWSEPPALDASWFSGLTYRKLGLAGCGNLPVSEWAEAWSRLRQAWGAGPAWVAVVYADWVRADAPAPDVVAAVALAAGCAGVLVDTWDKTRPSPIDLRWEPWIRRVQRAGLFLALAGGLDAASIARLAPLRPDLFAVRGAACKDASRCGAIDPNRVATLVRALESHSVREQESSREASSKVCSPLSTSQRTRAPFRLAQIHIENSLEPL
jgi:(5-formylfuran-3-yl)methyl phosphate synthase